jgi:AraC-like DNA-binding protein
METAFQSKTGRGDTLPFKQALETLARVVPATQSLVITTMPRGSLQIAQPARVPESLLRSYAREYHVEDRLTWQALLSQQPVLAGEALGEQHPFLGFLRGNGLAHAAAAPLRSPVLGGYDGALHVYRTAEEGPFSADDLRKLADAAEEIDTAVAQSRETRRGVVEETPLTLTHRPKARLYAFDSASKQLLNQDDFERLDARLRDEMAEQARARLARLNGELMTADRVQMPDSRGDLWTFRVVTYARYPGIADEPLVLVCMQPSCSEWGSVRPADLQADAEIARLIPALKFMRQEYHRGPTLGEISRQVHLSPFHFHRRFAELLGLTPKHYLLECQITEAKSQLLAGRKELAQIAADCGFAHQSHFTSRFKQATGLTPTRWRRLARERRG